MLPKENRLTKRQVRYVLAKGKRNSFHAFTLCSAFNRADVYRFGVMVSTKVYSRAVERNRTRRQIYGVIELWLKTPGNSLSHCSVMIIVRRPVASRDLQKFYQLLNNTLI